uniref:Small ribosomal subunit protein uS3c n=1 Tax=Proteomonas sulcata TaxID=77928 RepID=A0A2P1G8A5_9CRYP|nr:ribosomal protein S3 [Proteomonas sulcata]AVM81194.1 ribosomal protein S3 [Proteomonas sulcata]
MGQKANINGLHLSKNKDWNSVWYLDKTDYSGLLMDDYKIYKYYFYNQSHNKNLLKIRIYRFTRNLLIFLVFSHELKKSLKDLKQIELKPKDLNIKNLFVISHRASVTESLSEVTYLAQKVAYLIEKRVSFRSYTIKTILEKVYSLPNVKGVGILCSGRLNDVDMAKTDSLSKGSIPFQSLNINLNYGFATANTTKGLIGIKVWIYYKK